MQIFRPPDLAASDALTPRLAEQLSRIKADLRLGLPVALIDGAASALVVWIETLTEDRLAALQALGQAQVALTRHRAAAVGLAAADGTAEVIAVELPEGAGLAWLRHAAGSGSELLEGMAPGTAPARPGTPLDHAAVALAKSEQFLPAVLVLPRASAEADAARLGLMSMRADDVMTALEVNLVQACVSSAGLPMEAAEAGRVHVFRPDDGSVEHYAVEVGTPDLTGIVTVRLHSACFTGDVLGSRKCDCGPQLRGAMAAMAAADGGVLLYLNQEGRGIGLANKMRAYRLQDAGLDTVEANHWLGFDDDERDFRIGANMLHGLGITRVRLMTNNPAKIAILTAQGIEVVERVPLHVGQTALNAGYLATKASKSGHLLP